MRTFINFINNESKPHKHKHFEIIVYTNGRGTFHSDTKSVEVFSGKIMIIPPETTHSSTFENTLGRIYIGGDFSHIFNISVPTVIWDTPEKEGAFLANMIYKNKDSNPEYLSALLDAFTHFLMQNIKIDDEITIAVKNIVNEIKNNFSDINIDVCSLLNQSGYAEDYIRANFKKITGKTPILFLTETRINHARFLIDVYQNSLTLSEIAEKCGYNDYIYFSRKFKQVTGISPRKYMLL